MGGKFLPDPLGIHIVKVFSDNGLTHVTKVTEFRQPLQVQSHLEMPRILVQLGHTQRT